MNCESEKKISKTFRLSRKVLGYIDEIIEIFKERNIQADKTKIIELSVISYYCELKKKGWLDDKV